jgi:hypothetical protein
MGTVACIGLDGVPAIDLDVASAENQEFLSTRNGERREMIVLNDRLAVYIDKVRSLCLSNSQGCGSSYQGNWILSHS